MSYPKHGNKTRTRKNLELNAEHIITSTMIIDQTSGTDSSTLQIFILHVGPVTRGIEPETISVTNCGKVTTTCFAADIPTEKSARSPDRL